MKTILKLTALLLVLAGSLGSCEEKDDTLILAKSPEIFVCGVRNPLYEIEWLKVYWRNICEIQGILTARIELYKAIDNDEFFFLSITDNPTTYPSICRTWKDCAGETILTMTEDDPFVIQKQYDEFLSTKEFVVELCCLLPFELVSN